MVPDHNRAIQTGWMMLTYIMMESLHSFHSIANFLIDTSSDAWVDKFDTPIGILDWLDSLLHDQDGANLDDTTIQLLIDLGVHNGFSFLLFAQGPFPVLLASLSTADCKCINGEGLCNLQIYGGYLSEKGLMHEDGQVDRDTFDQHDYSAHHRHCHRQVGLSFKAAFCSKATDHYVQAEADQTSHALTPSQSGPPFVIMTPSVAMAPATHRAHLAAHHPPHPTIPMVSLATRNNAASTTSSMTCNDLFTPHLAPHPHSAPAISPDTASPLMGGEWCDICHQGRSCLRHLWTFIA